MPEQIERAQDVYGDLVASLRKKAGDQVEVDASRNRAVHSDGEKLVGYVGLTLLVDVGGSLDDAVQSVREQLLRIA